MTSALKSLPTQRLSAIWALLCVLAVAMAGCAATPTPIANPPRYQTPVGRVAVVLKDAAPEISFAGFAKSKDEGARIGAQGVFSGCFGSGGSAGSGPGAGIALIVLLGICGIASVGAGAIGAANAPTADQAAASEALLFKAVEVRTIQDALGASMIDAARHAGVDLIAISQDETRQTVAQGDYRGLTDQGVDTVLEATISKVGTEGEGVNNPLLVYMEAKVRLVTAADNAERFAYVYRYEGRRLKLAGWSAEEGKPLRDELLKAYSSLATEIAETVFSLYPFPHRGETSLPGGRVAHGVGLAPIYPTTLVMDQFKAKRPDIMARTLGWGSIKELQPRFEWQAFPRAEDLRAAPEDMARVTDVTYELVVARQESDGPGEVVYHAKGLPENAHVIPMALEHGTHYSWSVRPHFILAGQPMVSEWSSEPEWGSSTETRRVNIPVPSRRSNVFWVD